MEELAVRFTKVSKHFKLERKLNQNPIFGINTNKKNFFIALKNISFKVNKGEIVGIVGLNGSGKSTLSNLIATVSKPSSGKIEYNGTVSLLAINAGLKPTLTGYENIYLKCLFHGINKKNIDLLVKKIIRFSELGKFIHQPIKNYSSGMKAKLGFSVAIHMDPTILIIDEALAVGDQTFYQKCLDQILLFKEEGKTIFFVSHSIIQVKQLCTSVIWLDQGELKDIGPTKEVCENYEAFIYNINQLSNKEKAKYQAEMLKKRMIISSRKQKKKILIKWHTWLSFSIFILLILFSSYFM
ncbi:ABC transporter ATP-binding protein [Carnobacterium maltaromaticum]|uniref:ABC transporter ATP-binding protein n=1 Tax=Carnobacterium maltaromaticum TaxID=2751 RepID=UPI0039BE88FB